METEVAGLREEVDGYLRRAKEPDPDKRMYGEKMTAKILAASERFESVESNWTDAVEVARSAVRQAREHAEEARHRFEVTAKTALEEREREEAEKRAHTAQQRVEAEARQSQSRLEAEAMAAKQAQETAERNRQREADKAREQLDRARRAEESRKVRNFGQGTDVQRTAAQIARAGVATPAPAPAPAPAQPAAGRDGPAAWFSGGSASQGTQPL